MDYGCIIIFNIWGRKNVSTFVLPSHPYLSSHRNISVIVPSNLHFLTSLYYMLIVFRIICLAIKHYKNISAGYYGTDKRYMYIVWWEITKQLYLTNRVQRKDYILPKIASAMSFFVIWLLIGIEMTFSSSSATGLYKISPNL